MKATIQELPRMILKPQSFVDDKRKEGWKLVRDGEIVLQLDRFLAEGEPDVTGYVMLKRAKAMGDLVGQFHAERLLAQQTIIPKKWRSSVLIFAGTVWRHPKGGWLVSSLDWDGDGWYLHFNWLFGYFGSGYRFVRLGKAA